MYRHILVPLDGSPLAELVLPHVRAISPDRGARLTLLRSVARIPSHTIEFDRDAPSPLSEVQQHEQEARDYLAPLVAQLRADGFAAEGAVVLQNDAHEAIIDYALQHEVDIIALATHGRGGLGRLIFGSVAERLLHQSPLPLLVVRPRDA